MLLDEHTLMDMKMKICKHKNNNVAKIKQQLNFNEKDIYGLWDLNSWNNCGFLKNWTMQ